MCLSTPKAPKVEPPPPVPRPEDAFSAGNRELTRRRGAVGYQSTILGGALAPAPNATPQKTLLGG